MKLEKLFLPFLLILTVAVLSIGIKKPFIGLHDWNGVVYSQIARNYLRYGFLKTRFGQVLNPGRVAPENFVFSAHYPPLFPITLSFFFRIFGVNEWAARLLPITLSVLMIFYFYKLVALFWDKIIAFFASLFLVFTPMFIYFAKMPAHEILNTGTAVICFYYYFLWFKREDKKLFYLVFFLTLLREIIDWSGYFLPPLFLVHTYFFKKRALKKLLPLIPLSFLMFFFHLLYVKIVTGSFFGEGLLEILLIRLGLQTTKTTFFQPTIPQLLKKEFTVINLYFTRVIAFFSFIYLLLFVRRFFKKKKLDFEEYTPPLAVGNDSKQDSKGQSSFGRRSGFKAPSEKNLKNINIYFLYKDGLVLMLLSFGFAYGLIFRNALWFHDYLFFYALPFFALSATLAVNQLVNNKKLEKLVLLLIFVLFLTEKIGFTKALLESDYDGRNYQLCQVVNKMTEKESKVLLAVETGESVFFLNFYLDRPYKNILPKVSSFKDKEKEYRGQFDYLLAVEKSPQEFLDYLKGKYKVIRYENYYVFSFR